MTNFKKSGKISKRTAALAVACSLFMAQTDAHAFLNSISPALPQNIFSSSDSIQKPDVAFVEKAFVKNAIAPLQAPDFQIPQSVLAQFNPFGSNPGGVHSKIYYDPSGRRVLRHEFSNQNYFETYRQGSSIETGKIRELKLAGSSNYKFRYYMNRDAQAVRIIQNLPSQKNSPYQAFEVLTDGRLGKLLETGSYEKGQFIRQRVYNYESGTITLNRPGNFYEKRIYELKPSGEAGRPIQYRNRTPSGGLVHVRFLYNDLNRTVTCLHLNGLHYAVYELTESQSVGALLKMGVAKAVSQNSGIIPQSEIELTTLRRDHKDIPVYIFRQFGEPGYTVRERSLEGADGLGVIGRVLRYSAVGIDLEYFYAERRHNQAGSLTVLNHMTGDRLRFELPEKVFDESRGRLVPAPKTGKELFAGAMAHDFSKFSVLRDNLVFALEGYHLILKAQEGAHASIVFLSRLLRGPPAEAPQLSVASAVSFLVRSLSSSFSGFTTSSIYSYSRRLS